MGRVPEVTSLVERLLTVVNGASEDELAKMHAALHSMRREKEDQNERLMISDVRIFIMHKLHRGGQ